MKKKRLGLGLMLGGFVVAFLPVFIAVSVALVNSVSPFDESGGSGAVLWLLIATFPSGMVIGTVGFVLYLVGLSKERQTRSSSST